MTLRQFEGQTFGKWILAGEHAVLRGCPALAFPLLSRSIRIQYLPSDQPLQVTFEGTHGSELQLLFWGVLEKALEDLKQHVNHIGGQIKVASDLPMGAGLGASAALCSGIGRWCEGQGYLKAPEVYEFSRRLENMFHGESSGVDIAVSMGKTGIRFTRDGQITKLTPSWSPKLYLSYSGQRGVTSECVAKVKSLIAVNPGLGERLDQQMKESVRLCEQALAQSESLGIATLKTAILLARDCFDHWDLIPPGLHQHIQELERAGAWAVKPTGSGGGGYVLSLWGEAPGANLAERLIPLDFA